MKLASAALLLVARRQPHSAVEPDLNEAFSWHMITLSTFGHAPGLPGCSGPGRTKQCSAAQGSPCGRPTHGTHQRTHALCHVQVPYSQLHAQLGASSPGAVSLTPACTCSFMAWNYYPSLEGQTASTPRLFGHADMDCLSLLYQREGAAPVVTEPAW